MYQCVLHGGMSFFVKRVDFKKSGSYIFGFGALWDVWGRVFALA